MDFNTIGRKYDSEDTLRPASVAVGELRSTEITELVLQAHLRGKALAAFGAPGVDDGSTIFSGHTSTETVGALAMQIAGLIGSFHSGYRINYDS